MASTNRPLDESTATLVAPDDHLHAKDLLSTPTNTSTAISSGTVSDEEPSTPEPLADVPVSVLCGWPHSGGPNGKTGHGVTKESGWPHEDDPKHPAAKYPKGLTSLGTDEPNPGDSSKDDPAKDWPADGNASKPDPAKLHTLNGTSNDGTDSTSKDESVSVLCGWPHANGPKDSAVKGPKGVSPVGVPDNGSDLVPQPGDASRPDPAKGWPNGNASKPDPAKRGRQGQRGNGTGEAGTDAPFKDESGWPHLDDQEERAAKNLKGLPPVGGVPDDGDEPSPGDPSKNDPAKDRPDSEFDRTQPETAGPERRKPGTVGPEGQPPWGVKNLAATAANATSLEGPEGQPPWGIKSLGAAVNATGVAGPEGQPPWGIKNLGAAVNAKGVAGPEGQPPWGVKNLVTSGGGPEGQPPWGTKGRAATTMGSNESGKGDDAAQDASA